MRRLKQKDLPLEPFEVHRGGDILYVLALFKWYSLHSFLGQMAPQHTQVLL